jgi:tetratricopeptide (TPR) repeat protein
VTGYRQHSGSSLAPYFLALEVQSLIGQGKLNEAINSLDRVIGMISKNSPLYFTYAIQAARMKLDSDDESLKNNGLRDLEALAINLKNKNRDQALYYLAHYFAMQGSVDRAQELLNQLIVAFPEGGLASSPWTVLAQEKLKEYAA